MTPHLSSTVYPSTSSAVAPGRRNRRVDFASNRDSIGYCQLSRRELSRSLAASPSFPFVINSYVCHLLGQRTKREEQRGRVRITVSVSDVRDRTAQLFRALPVWQRAAPGVQPAVRPSSPSTHEASLRPTERRRAEQAPP